jgi:hypothetical protein
MIDLKALAVKRDINPDDLDHQGNVKPYIAPVFESVYTEDELAARPLSLPELLAQHPVEPLPESAIEGNGEIGLHSGWCPGGSVKNGICQPFNNAERRRWMGTYQTVRNLTIKDTILPGTHNSGSDKQASRAPSSETCQDVSPNTQLQSGIRVLDIRTQFFSGYASGDPRRFQIFHKGNSGRTIEGDIIQAAINLYTGGPQEIVILDFHEFKNFTEAAHRELADVIKRRMGTRLVVPGLQDFCISQLWRLKKNAVIAYNASSRDSAFWKGVNQRWIGKNTPSNDELRNFVSAVGREPKPENELRAVQAAKYSLPFFVPKDMSPEVMRWFAAGGSGPIMNHYIINTDWSLRTRHVDNCIYANQFRPHTPVKFYNPNSSPVLPDYFSEAVYELYNGGWAPIIKLPASTLRKRSFFVLRSSADYDAELQLDCSDGLSTIPICKGDAFALAKYNTREWRVACQEFTPNLHGATIPAPPAEDKFCRYIMSNGDWRELISLPATAAHKNIVLIASDATLTAKVKSNNVVGGVEYAINKGDRCAFMYNATNKLWTRL